MIPLCMNLKPTEIPVAIYATMQTLLLFLVINCSFKRLEEKENSNIEWPNLFSSIKWHFAKKWIICYCHIQSQYQTDQSTKYLVLRKKCGDTFEVAYSNQMKNVVNWPFFLDWATKRNLAQLTVSQYQITSSLEDRLACYSLVRCTWLEPRNCSALDYPNKLHKKATEFHPATKNWLFFKMINFFQQAR